MSIDSFFSIHPTGWSHTALSISLGWRTLYYKFKAQQNCTTSSCQAELAALAKGLQQSISLASTCWGILTSSVIFTSTVSKQPWSFLGIENVSVKLWEISLQYWSHHMTDYSRARKTMVWNPEAWGIFQEAKFEVSRCATMRFLSDTAPISLQTDTFDCGLREYLFQSRKEDLEFVCW